MACIRFDELPVAQRVIGRCGWRLDSCQWWVLVSVLVGSGETKMDGKTTINGNLLWWTLSGVPSLEWEDDTALYSTLSEAQAAMATIPDNEHAEAWYPVRLDDYLRWEQHRLGETRFFSPQRATSRHSLRELTILAQAAQTKANVR